MKIDSITGDMLLAHFKQMGAHEITNITSRLYYIGFKITPQIEITYVYNINKKDQYFLQRISPYPLPKGLFISQEEIIHFIETDLIKFRNAAQSSNFQDFITFNHILAEIENDMEHLFLNYNVPKSLLQEFNKRIHLLRHDVHLAKTKSMHIMVKS